MLCALRCAVPYGHRRAAWGRGRNLRLRGTPSGPLWLNHAIGTPLNGIHT